MGLVAGRAEGSAAGARRRQAQGEGEGEGGREPQEEAAVVGGRASLQDAPRAEWAIVSAGRLAGARAHPTGRASRRGRAFCGLLLEGAWPGHATRGGRFLCCFGARPRSRKALGQGFRATSCRARAGRRQSAERSGEDPCRARTRTGRVSYVLISQPFSLAASQASLFNVAL